MITTKVIDSVLSIGTFYQQFFVLKNIFQSLQPKDHVQTIGIHPSLSKNVIYEQKYPENIKKLYKQAGKCDDQQQFKDILEASIFSTPERFTDNSPISPMTSSLFKKPLAQKSLCMFTNVLYVKKNFLPSSWSC